MIAGIIDIYHLIGLRIVYMLLWIKISSKKIMIIKLPNEAQSSSQSIISLSDLSYETANSLQFLSIVLNSSVPSSIVSSQRHWIFSKFEHIAESINCEVRLRLIDWLRSRDRRSKSMRWQTTVDESEYNWCDQRKKTWATARDRCLSANEGAAV